MPAGAARTVTGISICIARDPALVRTARLVAAAVARRVTGDEEFVEDVRLAIGEACALLVDPELVGSERSGPVEVSISLDHRLRAVVHATGVISAWDPAAGGADGIEPWLLLHGLVEDLVVERGGGSTALSMSWPLPEPRAR